MTTTTDDVTGEAVPARARRRINWAAIAGALSLVYVLWYIGDLLVLNVNPTLFNTVHASANNLGMRSLFAVLFLAIVFHGLDGLRRTAIDLRPALVRRDLGLRAAVRFVTMAAAIPVALVLVWPTVRTWLA